MTNKLVLPYSDIRKTILEAVDMIANPVKQTLSPKGGNVIIQDDSGGVQHTNDGVTIAKNISSSDPVKNTIIDIIKHGSLKTNSEAGDGTTTTILLTQNLIKNGFKVIDEGMNEMVLKKELDIMGDKLVKKLKENVVLISNDKELINIATISANNDSVIAKEVVEVVKFAGEDGMIFIEANNKPKTEIDKEPGFMMNAGLFSQELRVNPSSFSVIYKDIPVFLTDKRIYYQEEAETILKIAVKSGFKSIMVIAKDFIGQAPNTFIANHSKGTIKVLLVKDNNNDVDDIATYLGGKVIKEKTGSLVNNISDKDFIIANQVYSDGKKTILTPKVVGGKEVTKLVDSLKEELKKDKEDKELKRRIASLTAGTTTIRVGGFTQMEQNEKIYRFEDAINATRTALKDGYLIGGGVALMNTFDKKDYSQELQRLVQSFTETSIRQIAINCSKHEYTVISNIKGNIGYNALTDKFEDLLKAGVIDPYKVTEMAIKNSISIAGIILSSKYLVVNELEDNNK